MALSHKPQLNNLSKSHATKNKQMRTPTLIQILKIPFYGTLSIILSVTVFTLALWLRTSNCSGLYFLQHQHHMLRNCLSSGVCMDRFKQILLHCQRCTLSLLQYFLELILLFWSITLRKCAGCTRTCGNRESRHWRPYQWHIWNRLCSVWLIYTHLTPSPFWCWGFLTSFRSEVENLDL